MRLSYPLLCVIKCQLAVSVANHIRVTDRLCLRGPGSSSLQQVKLLALLSVPPFTVVKFESCPPQINKYLVTIHVRHVFQPNQT